ncbi:MAG: endonuclease/exonuclease/phosphatase family protein [Lachnospiraceae bacterium]|nr:endonuclease/exonuclease/phosphatase family protein [Lachnospiraceae bacterium]
MQRKLPAKWVRTIKKHMDRLKASETFGDFLKLGVGKPEQLTGYGHIRYSLHVAANVRLILEPDADQNTVMICTEIEVEGIGDYHGRKENWYTSMGELTVYGTIIGVHGNRRASFYRDLEKQLLDIRHLASEGKALCICGDFNCSFGDNYYFTHAGRSSIIKCFQETGIRLITEKQTECIDHIAITEEFVCNAKVSVEEWNVDKRMSDHKGIAVEFT